MRTVTALEFLGGPWEILLRLGVATLIGCALGLNRELRNKPAGMRTHGLVCLGSSLITLASLQFTFDGVRVDASGALRAVQGIMAGIGFLGGGVILRDDSRQSIQGLTTAASIWVSACLGVACGVGQWLTALVALVLALLVLIVGAPLEGLFRRWLGPPPRSSQEEGNGRAPGSG